MPLQRDPWWRPELRGNEYHILGDAYDDEAYKKLAEDWKKDVNVTPYLKWVTELSNSGWIHLRPLADFMFIGATPQRWGELNPEQDVNGRPLNGQEITCRREVRQKRATKTNVSVLDYTDKEVQRLDFASAEELRKHLDDASPDEEDGFRLYVVEDLSRDVIEAFGHKFHIEPDFFRAHIADFAWYNVRDRWGGPPSLDIVSRHQNWMQLRYVTARYFDADQPPTQWGNQSDFQRAAQEAVDFNVLRRVDDDLSNRSYWDKQGSTVGLTRSRATFWLQPSNLQQGARVGSDYMQTTLLSHVHSVTITTLGILLLDPTVTQGLPLWRGRRILWSTPEYGKVVPPGPPSQDNLFDHFVFWAQRMNLYPHCNVESPSKALAPMQILLHFVCSEWLTMSDYIKTRLNQLDWEIVKPEYFRLGKEGVYMLEKLHMWRRLVPLYREMVTETIQHIDQFSDRIQIPTTTACDRRATTNTSINHYKSDLSHVQSQLEEYQKRVDQLTAVVTAVISIDNSRRSLRDSRNIGRLTWFATLFIPLSLVAGILSMQPAVSDISRGTFAVYFATSLPLIALLALAAGTISVYQSRSRRRPDHAKKTA